MGKTLQMRSGINISGKGVLSYVPNKATSQNIKDILRTMRLADTMADKMYVQGDFQRAMEYSEFVRMLDELVAFYKGKLPLESEL